MQRLGGAAGPRRLRAPDRGRLVWADQVSQWVLLTDRWKEPIRMLSFLFEKPSPL